MTQKKLSTDFYTQEDVVVLARSLLGKTLISYIDNQLTSGMVIETEAYAGVTDKASHAYGGRYTPRTKTLYEKGGVAYVYLCYGMHALFNVVTHKKGTPHAVLIRALQPLSGIEIMLQRRKKKKIDPSLCSGPGTLTKAMGIEIKHNGLSLLGNTLWIENGTIPKEKDITQSPRIGVAYAQEDAYLPWRFCLKI